MSGRILFPKLGKIMHGGDYNPEQWLDCPKILEEDIRLMKKAKVNCVTLGVFSWSVYEPEEGEFHFEWLHKIMDSLYENGIYTVLATPSGARPVWLDEKYPEAMRVSKQGIRNHHGVRHNHCMSSPVYREKVRIMDEHLAKEFGNHPGLLLWHVSNELGGECYCDLCKKRFQSYLAEKFDNDIEKLNKAWWTTFWSHKYQRFDQIEPPYSNGEGSVMALNLEWKQFTTWNMTDYMKSEIEVLKKITPDIPVTTNFMKLYPGLDYHEMSKELDIISWDSYPKYNNNYEQFEDTALENAFDHAVMRGMRPDQPFMLMESVPSLVNWHNVNKLKRPGVHRLACMQAAACGSDTVQYFQWRKSRGSFEQFHGAVIDHLGTDNTRVFSEVAEVGKILEDISEIIGSTVVSKAAILFDWNNRWAIQDAKAFSQDTKQYEKVCTDQYKLLMKLGIDANIIDPMDKLDNYPVVIAPMLYLLKNGCAQHIKEYVENGGTFIATYMTGYVDENTLCYLGGFPGDGLKEVFGLYSEEIDSLYPGESNQAVFKDEKTCSITDYAEILKVSDAEIYAKYKSDFYRDTPVVTVKKNKKGFAWYIGARLDEEGMKKIYLDAFSKAGLPVKVMPEHVEYHQRIKDNISYEFYLNNSMDAEAVVTVDSGTELITGNQTGGQLVLKPCEAAVIKRIQLR